LKPELEVKTERLIKLLASEKLGGVLLNSQHNFAWITGGSSNGIDLSRENGASSIFVRSDGKYFLLTNNIEMPRMLTEEVFATDFEPVEFAWQDEKSAANFVIKKAKTLSGDGLIATDIALHSQTQAIDGLIAHCRYSLTPEEVERYKQLGADAGRAIRNVIDKLEPGETELEVAAKMRHEFAKGNIASVVTLVAGDERVAKFRHPVPTENRWQKTLLLVSCAKRHGLIVSLSRLICFGEVPRDLQTKTEAAAFVNASFLHSTRPGTTGAELYKTAASAYDESGFLTEINLHHQGGAAGYKTRDWVAHPNSGEIVQANQAFAWNPSITGTKVEETVIASETGVEVITASPDFPVTATEIDGREYFSPGIFSL
jgi:Xaa-Pro dipeptidase